MAVQVNAAMLGMHNWGRVPHTPVWEKSLRRSVDNGGLASRSVNRNCAPILLHTSAS